MIISRIDTQLDDFDWHDVRVGSKPHAYGLKPSPIMASTYGMYC